MKLIAGLALAAALAGCGGATEGSDVANVAEVAEANASLTEPANVTAAAVPADNAAAPTADADRAIPAALLGDWALVAGDCTTTWGDAKGLLTVTATELRFYESRGKLGQVIESSPSRITADFDFQGEGEEWQRRMTLEKSGDALVRSEAGEGAAPEPFRYRRCPA